MAEQKEGCRISRYVCCAAALLYAIFHAKRPFFIFSVLGCGKNVF